MTGDSAQSPDPNDTGCTDLGYWELYTRWLQYAAFVPMFRSHGTDAPREPWRFGEPGTAFYDAIVQYIRLRYQLLPLIYSVAAQVSLNSWSMMRAVALDFPQDLRTHGLTDQFMFGPGLMVCPVTKPMYYGPNSEPISSAEKTRPVYLPRAAGWYDFHTRAWFPGGSSIDAIAPLEIIPLFARAGAIVPMCPAMQYVDEIQDAPYEVRVYCGADGVFPLYEDEGDNYNYERGRYLDRDAAVGRSRRRTDHWRTRGRFRRHGDVTRVSHRVHFQKRPCGIESDLPGRGDAGSSKLRIGGPQLPGARWFAKPICEPRSNFPRTLRGAFRQDRESGRKTL